MDFEVLGGNDGATHPLHALEQYFRNRRRQLQDWESNPPHRLGVLILVLSLLEMVIGWRLIKGTGYTSELVTHALMLALAVALVEVGLARIASEVAVFFKKKGNV